MIRLRFNFAARLPGRSATVTISVDGNPMLITTLRNARSYL